MNEYASNSAGTELDVYIDAFEAAQSTQTGPGPADIRRFLPEPSHPLYLAVLRELVRVDMEYGWKRRKPRRLEEYQKDFPELFKDRKSLQDITFEEYRLRRLGGENPQPNEYQQRFGVVTVDWPRPGSPSGELKLRDSNYRPKSGSESGHDLDAALAYLENLVKQAQEIPEPPAEQGPIPT